MALDIDQSFVDQFEREVHEAYQRRGSLIRGTTRTQNNVVGQSTTWQKTGKGQATTKARNGTISPMNVSHTPVPVILEDYYAGDWVDKLDELKVKHDERMVLANAGAWALGRKTDEQLTDEMNTSTTTTGTGATLITRNIFLETVEALDDNDVPDDGDRYGLLTPRQWATAMTISEFVNADFIGAHSNPALAPFANGMQNREWLGVKWLKHTGLPAKGTSGARGFAYHRTSMGHAIGADITTDITWHGDRASHFVNHMMSMNATLIDELGCVIIETDDTLALP